LKQLRKEGIKRGRYRVRGLMKRLKLRVTQRRAYKITTVRKHTHGVADNLVNQDFNPKASNQVWAGDITYLRTHEGWLYLAIVMDLHSITMTLFGGRLGESQAKNTSALIEPVKSVTVSSVVVSNAPMTFVRPLACLCVCQSTAFRSVRSH
jgi:hypothetical protein